MGGSLGRTKLCCHGLARIAPDLGIKAENRPTRLILLAWTLLGASRELHHFFFCFTCWPCFCGDLRLLPMPERCCGRLRLLLPSFRGAIGLPAQNDRGTCLRGLR